MASVLEYIDRYPLRLRLVRFWKRFSKRSAVAVRATFRKGARDSELMLTLTSAALGAAIGLAVVALVALMHEVERLVFEVGLETQMRWEVQLAWWRVLLLPTLGGLLVGVMAFLMRLWRPKDTIDAIEANALYGGKMSLIDSINLAILTFFSVGSGASLGMEAAATQVGAGTASVAGSGLRLRRADLRTLVGCGGAAALAALFHAPLTGAFYAFELIIASYSLALLAPVAVAALVGSLVAQTVFGARPMFVVDRPVILTGWDYVAFVGLGFAAALVAIATMRLVTMVERNLRRTGLPVWSRPMVGGFLVGCIGLFYPQVLGSGHSAILYSLHVGFPWLLLAVLVMAKVVASALSVGSGFRGGLFSSSLFIGALFGNAAAVLIQSLRLLIPDMPVMGDDVAYALVGMGAVAAGIVGAPMTMILLVLETSGSFPLTIGVMVGVLTCTATVRRSFGYSFATWRFHLRGLRILGGSDVGWIGDLTVGRLMSGNVKRIPDTASVADLRAKFPLGSAKRVFVVDASGRYLGLIDIIEAHGSEFDDPADANPVTSLLHGEPIYLLPETNIRSALTQFVVSQSETLAVVENRHTRRLVGYLSESYSLRRYNEELERRRLEESGDSTIFSPLAGKPD